MAAGQQFNLRWNNHTNNIVQVFTDHFLTESLVDVTLSCEGQFLKVHRMVLSACSPYFQEMFRHHLHQVPNTVIIINGIKYSEVKQIVEFMYKGEVKVHEGELNGLLAAAEGLQVKGLSNVRNKYEKGDIDTNTKAAITRDSAASVTSDAATPIHLKRKRRRPSEETVGELVGTLEGVNCKPSDPSTSNGQTTVQSSQAAIISPTFPQTQTNFKAIADDDLPATIKVEPLDIRDIDGEPSGWESPKLIIDLMEGQARGASREQEVRVTKRMVVNSVIVKRGRGRPRKAQTDDDEEIDSSPNLCQTPKGLLKVKPPGLSPKKLMPGSPQWHRKRTSKIPRPPNAFMIFANEYRRKLAFDNPTENNKEISCRLGTMWKNLPPEVKETYYTQSREADEEHKRKYPGYYYSPKEARLRKNLKADMAVARRGPRGMDANYLVNVVMPEDDNDDDAIPSSYLLFNDGNEDMSPSPTQKKVIPLIKQLQKIAPKIADKCQPSEFVAVNMEECVDSNDAEAGNENQTDVASGNENKTNK